jgi:putative ABC transport system substrate-binding protein
VTGLSYLTEETIAKRLQLLKEVVPGLARVGVLRNPPNPVHPILWKETEVAAQRLGVALEVLEVRGPEDFDTAFATAKQRNAQALLPRLPAAACRPCTAFVNSRMRGA